MELPPGIVRTSIYMLSDPETGRVRYVGKTIRLPEKRLHRHVSIAKRGTRPCHRNNWIRSLTQPPVLTTLEVVTGSPDEGCEVERRWIAKLRSDGCGLVNATDGGEGTLGHHHSAETREMLRRISAGKSPSLATRAKMRAAVAGRPPVSAETRAKISAIRRGKTLSAETRAKISAAAKLRPHSKHTEESKRKIAEWHRGKPVKPETRQKLRDANLGKKHGLEARRKIVAALKARVRRPESYVKTAAFHRGRKRSAETCRRISEALIARRSK